MEEGALQESWVSTIPDQGFEGVNIQRGTTRKKTAMGHLPGNVPDRDPDAEKPLQKLVAGIACIPTRRGWRYFGPVLDLYDRETVTPVLFLPMRPDLSRQLSDGPEALGPGSGTLPHSDRSGDYTAVAYGNRLTQMGITRSMPRPGNCGDTACAGSFSGHMKDGLGIMENGRMGLVDYARMRQMIMN